MAQESSGNQFFSTRLGLILSVLGIAIGTGNLWRFPRIAALSSGDGGAGAFLIAWVVCLFTFAIPLMIVEYGTGLNGRQGVIGSFIELIGQKFAWLGAFIAIVTTGIMCYYSVVTGWSLFYLIQSIFTELPANLSQAQQVWSGFQESAWPVVFHALMMGAGGWIVFKGVSSIERINKIMIPSLFVILVICIIRALTLPGSFTGLSFLFTPDWSTLGQFDTWLQALTQTAWSTGAAWGLILTYAAYMRSRDDIVLSAFQAGIGNNLVGLLAAMIIFPTVFAMLGGSMNHGEILQVMQTSGPAGTGLTFMWLPRLFAEMSGGRFFAVIFFLGLTFAAFTSLISMIEMASRVIVDMGISRRKATLGVCTVGFLIGLPSAISTGFLINQDTVWGIGLLVSGGLMAFAVIKYGPANFRTNLVNFNEGNYTLGRWWEVFIKIIVPIEVITLVGWWIYQSTQVSEWYMPFTTFSLLTIVVQWGIALGLAVFFNRKIAAKTTGKS